MTQERLPAFVRLFGLLMEEDKEGGEKVREKETGSQRERLFSL